MPTIEARRLAHPQRVEELETEQARCLGPGTHYVALDGVRGVAIVMVMVYHFTESARWFGVSNRTLGTVTGFGWSGVDLFFVLSGFLITGILVDAHGTEHFFRNFYARRSLRIFPIYYAVLIAYGLGRWLLPASPDPLDLQSIRGNPLGMWLYLTNLVMAYHNSYVYGILSHFWTLSVEEQFYLFWPAVIAFLPRRALIGLCLALLPMAFGLRLTLAITTGETNLGYWLTPCRMDAFAIGGLIAILGRSPGWYAWLRKSTPWLLAASATVVAGIMVYVRDSSHFNTTMNVVGFSALAVAYGSILFLAVSRGDWPIATSLLTSRPLRSIGKYSYGLYILHQPMIPIFERLFRPTWLASVTRSNLVALVVYNLLCGLAAYGLAYLSWHLLEKRFLSLKRFFSARTAPTV